MGRPVVLGLTDGNVSDIRAVGELLDAAGPIRRMIADKRYDANALLERR
jgi:hypothetical protein